MSEDEIKKSPLTPSTNELLGMNAESLKKAFVNHIEYSLGKDQYSATDNDCYMSLALATRDRLIERWIATQTNLLQQKRQASVLPLARVPHRAKPRQ